MPDSKRQRDIVKCAAKVFADKGYHKTSISDIIKAAGIARGTYYLYFENKRSIFQYILDSMIEDIQRLIARFVITNDAEISPLKQLKDNTRRLINYFGENPEYIKILFHYGYGMDEEMDQLLDRFYEKIIGIIQRSLSLGNEWGIIKRADYKTLSYAMIGILKETLLFISRHKKEDVDIEFMTQEIVNFAVFGIANNQLPGGKDIWQEQ